MNDPAETIVPLAFILVVFGLPLTLAIVNRVYAHQERIEMLKRGIVPPPDPKWARRAARAGWYDPNTYGMPQGQPGVAPPPYDAYAAMCNNPNRMLRKGITLAMIGFALLVGLSFIDVGRPGPWLLGGLIPLFVGIAQIIISLISGASLGPFGMNAQAQQQWQQPGTPPPAQAQASAQQPFTTPRDVTPGGYGGWRPGPTAGLEKPPSPPDVR
jgi:hypothetical protein